MLGRLLPLILLLVYACGTTAAEGEAEAEAEARDDCFPLPAEVPGPYGAETFCVPEGWQQSMVCWSAPSLLDELCTEPWTTITDREYVHVCVALAEGGEPKGEPTMGCGIADGECFRARIDNPPCCSGVAYGDSHVARCP